MEWNKQLGQAIATGNAKAIQGQTTIQANIIIAVLNKDNSQQITELHATGNVMFLKDKQIATGDKAKYYLKQDKVIITGNVNFSDQHGFNCPIATNATAGSALTIEYKVNLTAGTATHQLNRSPRTTEFIIFEIAQ